MKYLDFCSCHIIPLLRQGCPFRPFHYIPTFFFLTVSYSLIHKGRVIVMNILFVFLVPQIKDALASTKGLLPDFGPEHRAEKMRHYIKKDFFSKKEKEAPVSLEMIASNHLCTPEGPYWRFIIKYSFSHY